MSAGLAAHRAAVLALLQSVPDIGVVHDIEPYARAESDFRAAYLHTLPSGAQQLRGWHVRRVSTAEAELSTGTVRNTHTWRVTGFLALDYPARTEATFDDLIEAVRHAYRLNPTLSGVNQLGELADFGMPLLESGPSIFCGLLCHRAVLQLRTVSYLTTGD